MRLAAREEVPEAKAGRAAASALALVAWQESDIPVRAGHWYRLANASTAQLVAWRMGQGTIGFRVVCFSLAPGG